MRVVRRAACIRLRPAAALLERAASQPSETGQHLVDDAREQLGDAGESQGRFGLDGAVSEDSNARGVRQLNPACHSAVFPMPGSPASTQHRGLERGPF